MLFLNRGFFVSLFARRFPRRFRADLKPHGIHFLDGHFQRPALFFKEALEVIAEAHAVVKIKCVVPLFEPGEEICQGGEQGFQFGGRPAVSVFGIEEILDERLGLLKVVPAGPGDERRRVAIALGTGVADPALLGHVELAAEFPETGFLESPAAILGRNGDVADFFQLRLADQRLQNLFIGLWILTSDLCFHSVFLAL